MGIQWQDGGYSSEVEIWLLIDGEKLPVAQVGPESLILRTESRVHSGHAQLLIVVDGVEEVQDIILNVSDESALELAYA